MWGCNSAAGSAAPVADVSPSAATPSTAQSSGRSDAHANSAPVTEQSVFLSQVPHEAPEVEQADPGEDRGEVPDDLVLPRRKLDHLPRPRDRGGHCCLRSGTRRPRPQLERHQCRHRWAERHRRPAVLHPCWPGIREATGRRPLRSIIQMPPDSVRPSSRARPSRRRYSGGRTGRASTRQALYLEQPDRPLHHRHRRRSVGGGSLRSLN